MPDIFDELAAAKAWSSLPGGGPLPFLAPSPTEEAAAAPPYPSAIAVNPNDQIIAGILRPPRPEGLMPEPVVLPGGGPELVRAPAEEGSPPYPHAIAVSPADEAVAEAMRATRQAGLMVEPPLPEGKQGDIFDQLVAQQQPPPEVLTP